MNTLINIESVLIIPDNHGLPFWRNAVESSKAEKTIFLGDYVDPYGPMDWYDVYLELNDILRFKKEDPEKVTLLWGNHDLSYLYSFLRGSRYDYKAADSYLSLFMENRDCFQMADDVTLPSGNRYLFSHAGLNRNWILANYKIFGQYEEISASILNGLANNRDFLEALSNISRYRGGFCSAGSMIWADCHEFEDPKSGIPEYMQIFGHTRQSDGNLWHNSTGNAYCLDCGKAFVLDSDGLKEV